MHPVMIAARLLVRDMGSADVAAPHLGKSASTLSHELDPNYKGAKLGLLDALTLTQASGDDRIATAFAAACGGVFLKLPQDGSQAGDDTVQHVTRVVGEFGDVLREVSGSTADGQVSDNELVRVQAEALEAIGALQRMLAHLAQLNQAGKSAPHLQRVA